MSRADDVYIVVRCLGQKSLKLRRGETLRIGRHHTNDLVLNDSAISRFHCSIEWDSDDDRPWLVDNGSANGVEVDGREVDGRCVISGDNQLTIGDFTVVLQLKAGVSTTRKAERPSSDSAILDDDGSGPIRLFSEKTGRMRGDLQDGLALQRLLLDLEAGQRTGTLTVREGAETSRVMFGMGRVVTARRGEARGRAALLELLNMSSAAYEFRSEIEPAEESLDLSIQEFLAQEGQLTARMVRRPPSPDPDR